MQTAQCSNQGIRQWVGRYLLFSMTLEISFDDVGLQFALRRSSFVVRSSSFVASAVACAGRARHMD